MLQAEVAEVQEVVQRADIVADALDFVNKQQVAELIQIAFMKDMLDFLPLMVEQGISDKEAKTDEVMAAIKARIESDDFLGPYIASFQETFSPEEIQSLIQFYQSEAVKKMFGTKALYTSIPMGMMQTLIEVIDQYPDKAKEELAAGNSVVHVTSKNFQSEVLESNLPVVLDAYGDLCAPCKQMAPLFDELSDQMKGKVKFVRLNAQTESVARELGIKSLPTFVFFKNGNIVERHIGTFEKGEFTMKLAKAFL